MRDIVATALGLDVADVDLEAPFIDLGASSLALVDAFRAIYECFGVRPSIRKVFDEYDCIERLADYVLELLATQPAVDPEQVRAERRAALQAQDGQAFTTLPLTAAQTHLWFLAAYSDGAMLAHTHRIALQVTGPLDAAALRRAFQAVADRHQALRLVFDTAEAQRVALERPVSLEVVDFAGQPDEARLAAAGDWLRTEGRRPFEPADSLWRAALLRLRPERHLLIVSAHALVADEPALQRLLAEVAAVYTSWINGAAPALEAAVPFQAYVDALAEHANQPQYARSREFWSGVYADGIPSVDLAAWQNRPPVKSYAGTRLVVPLPAALGQALQDWNTAHKGSPYVTLLAAFQLWLQRMSGQDDLVVGVMSRGSTLLPRAGSLIANTTNPLPMRTRVDAAAPFADLVQKVQDSLLTAFDYQDYPFSAIIQDLDPERDQSRSPVFTVAFDWQPEAARLDFGGPSAQPITAPIQYVPYDLFLTVIEVSGQMQLQCDYSTELFDSATIRRWMNSFRTLLAACLEPQARPMAQLPMLTLEERRQMLVEWNDTARAYPNDICVHQLLEAQAARTPGAVALVDRRCELTYAELNDAAEQIAASLRQAGVVPGAFVAVCLDRSSGALASLLGVLKSGGAYVFLDPAFPVERLAFMLQDSQAAILVTESEWRDRFPGYAGQTFLLDGLALARQGKAPASGPAANRALALSSGHPAMMIYTSGSTGRPKGVLIAHRGVVNLLHAVTAEPGLSPGDRLLAVTTLSFDIAGLEIYLPLMIGATVVLASRDDASDGERLLALLQRSGATVMQATPATWQMLLAAGWQGDGRLKMLCGGEAMSRQLADALLARGGSLWNLYGPTETTIYSTGHKVEKRDGAAPIGRPLANTQLYVLDRHLQPVPIGVPGELLIGGDGVSPGYWQRPELTAEKFVPNPFVEAAPGQPRPKLYRTGDLVRYLPNGDVAYLGRMDFQVKIKGFRIELGEVESALGAHPAVGRSVVVARDDDHGRKYLAAYFLVRDGQAPPATTELRAHLSERLPEYMIPAAFVPLEAFPLTPNGKVNRRALPAPERGLRAGLDRAYAAPRNRVEEILCRIWGEVLSLEKVGIHDNFFDLGGHSLLLTPLVLKLREYFQLRISMREFFSRPTVAELAEMIAEARGHAPAGGNGHWISPTLRQDGPEAKARFDFLRAEARLDPALQPKGQPYAAKAGLERLFMTGTTGFVGAYLLRNLMEQTDVVLYTLVRADDEAAGLARIRRQASKLGLWQEHYQDRLRVITGDVSQPRLGLEKKTYQRLAGEVDAVLHSAAVVNFIYPYQAMKAVNVEGVRRVIEFAFEGQVKPVHYLSTTAIWPMGAHRTFTEAMDLDHDLLLNLAYDETKWVAEKMLREAASRGLPLAVYRPGEVSGDSRTGFSDLSHLASALLKGSIQAGMFPALDSFLDAAPVDYVAQAIVYLMTRRQPLGRAFHLCNPRPMHAHDGYTWLRKRGYTFGVIPFDEWRWRILTDDAFPENALYPFAALLEEFTELSLQLPVWDTAATVKEFAGSEVACPPLDEALADVYLRYFIEAGYLPTAEAMAAVR
ncbi:MAG: amino acid adenylation domain-containing protein [Anaerolineales bacterium]|nr:amino acid adenylation domain-containing protein [Anaerolineales bacterium]